MKKVLLALLTVITLATTLFCGGAVYAQDEELPSPGLTPDSPFYFLDRWGKNISMFFTFGAEAKAKRALRYAEERLAEAQAMVEKNRLREMVRAANDYEGFMAMVRERLEAAVQAGASANIPEEIAQRAYRIHEWLGKMKDRLPPQSQDSDAASALRSAWETTTDCQINALRQLAKEKLERALDISARTAERLMERARNRLNNSDNATDNATRDISEALDYARRITDLEEEMTAIAEEKGLDITALKERLAHSTSHRLEVLTEIYERAPEEALKGIANAIENSVTKYERVVERLKELPSDNATSTNITALKERIRERLKLRESNQVQAGDNATREMMSSQTREQHKEKSGKTNTED